MGDGTAARHTGEASSDVSALDAGGFVKAAVVNLKRIELDHLMTLVRDNLSEGS
jgi:hypothetical protein